MPFHLNLLIRQEYNGLRAQDLQEAKDQLYQKLAKMKNQRRVLLAQLNENKTNAGTTEEKQVLENLNAQALKLDGTIKNCDVDLHRIELDVREAAREKRKEIYTL